MLLLIGTTDKLQVITTAGTVDVQASWLDYNGTIVTTGSTPTAISGGATTDVVATPASSTTRNVKELHLRNKHASAATDITIQVNRSATVYEIYKETLQAGESLHYLEGVGFFKDALVVLPRIGRVLTADNTGGQNVATAQPWFPTNPALSVAALTTYEMYGLLMITHGATTHTTGLNFTGTATLTSIDYFAQTNRSAANGLNAVYSGIEINVATNVVTDVTGTQVATYVEIRGILRVNAAGTLIPNFQFSANPTGTITIKRNTHFWLEPIGSNAVDMIGTWA